jgi:hypothetical protein
MLGCKCCALSILNSEKTPRFFVCVPNGTHVNSRNASWCLPNSNFRKECIYVDMVVISSKECLW